MLSLTASSTPGLGIYSIRAARRIIDWTWIVPEETPSAPNQEPIAPSTPAVENLEDLWRQEIDHAA